MGQFFYGTGFEHKIPHRLPGGTRNRERTPILVLIWVPASALVLVEVAMESAGSAAAAFPAVPAEAGAARAEHAEPGSLDSSVLLGEASCLAVFSLQSIHPKSFSSILFALAHPALPERTSSASRPGFRIDLAAVNLAAAKFCARAQRPSNRPAAAG